MKLNPFFRCYCGKLHVATFIDQFSRCSKCGAQLLDLFKKGISSWT